MPILNAPGQALYEDTGSGFPLLIIPGRWLDWTRSFFTELAPFNAIEEFRASIAGIAMDLRSATAGAPPAPSKPIVGTRTPTINWPMQHLGIDRFMVMGFYRRPFIWSLLQRRRIALQPVLAQPSGHRPSAPDQFHQKS